MGLTEECRYAGNSSIIGPLAAGDASAKGLCANQRIRCAPADEGLDP